MNDKDINTLIFDFDGTLADTVSFTINSALEINRKLKLLNDEKIDMEKFRSMDASDFFKSLHISMLTLLFYIFNYQRKLNKEMDLIKTFNGLPEVLKELKSKGMHMGIVTSNTKKNVRKFLKNNDLEYFDFIYSSIMYFRKDKMIDLALRKYKINKKDAIYVGDEIRDIKAAKSAGIKIASVSWGYNFESVLAENKPDFIINQPKELLNLLY